MSNTEISFFSKLNARVIEVDSHLCVGLDPHIEELFPHGDGHKKSEEERCNAAFTHCKNIIDLTAPHVAAFKPNAAFFEALGPNLGFATLKRVVSEIPPSIPVLLDVKRGDIGSTANAYAEACFENITGISADGVTLSPLMGWDSVAPFITGKYRHKGAFVLCKTSNPGSNAVLALDICDGIKLFQKIASLAKFWSDDVRKEKDLKRKNEPPRIGLVVGATDPEALASARAAVGPDLWILSPGIGAQGGQLDEACLAGMNRFGTNMLIPISRAIGRAEHPCMKAKEFKDRINSVRQVVKNIKCKGNDITSTSLGEKSPELKIAPYQQDFLQFSLEQGVLKFGRFVLKSGRTSPYFFNAGLFSSGASLFKLGKSYAASIMASRDLTSEEGDVFFDAIFGPAYKGISLGAIVGASLYNEYGVDVGFAYDRKEAKDHGERGKLVGSILTGKRVLIIDDVISAGTAIRQSFDLLCRVGANPIGVSIALDRAEKRSLDDPISAVQAVVRDLKIPVVSIVSLPQLEALLQTHPKYGIKEIELLRDYRAKYGT